MSENQGNDMSARVQDVEGSINLPAAEAMSDFEKDIRSTILEADSLEGAVFSALGAASMCWSETPRGIFMEQFAATTGRVLLERINREIRAASVG